MIGNSTASVNTIATTARERKCGAIRAIGEACRSQAKDSPIPVLGAGSLVSAISGAGGGGAAEQPGRDEN